MNNKTISGLKCILYLFGSLALSSPAQAASFDCAKAGTKVEELICSDAKLSKLDEELNAAYKTALQDETQANTVKQAQKLWLKERNGCLDASCLNSSYTQRIAQLKVGGAANTNATSEAKAEKLDAGISPLTAGWDYKQEGGGMGTEPYTIGGDDVMCQQVKDYMNRVAPNWTADRENFCTSAVRLFPGFTEPPWTELDPHQHEELIAQLLRYRVEGAREYFGFALSPYRRKDAYYREEVRHFIESGGRLQLWKTHLLDIDADPKDLIDKHLPPGDQPVIQLRFAIDHSIDARFRKQTCHLPNWRGAVFLVTEDLSGPDPRVFDGGPSGRLSSSSLFIYEGKPILLKDGGYEISIHKNWDGTFLSPKCTFIYPYYKFEQRK